MGINDNSFDNFTKEVCSQIKCTEVHEDIKEELAAHLEDLSQEYIAQGSTAEEAQKLAIAHMGDSEKIGFDLNKIYQKRPEYKTLLISAVFVFFGLFVQFSIMKASPEVMPFNSYMRIIIFTILGAILGICAYLFDYRKLERYGWRIFIVTSLFLFATLITGHQINGATRMSLLGIGFDINLFCTALYIICLSSLLPKINASKYGVLKILLLLAFCEYLLATGGQQISVVIFPIMSIVLLLYCGVKKRYIISAVSLGIALFAYLIHSRPYLLHRLFMFINFKSDKQGSGYINNKIYNLLSTSNLLGNGPSNEVIKGTPIINQDLIYTYIIYTFGWIVGITLIILVLILILNLLNTSKHIKNRYGKTLFASITSFFALEFILAILMSLNLAPIMATSLPFFSYSGSATIINMILIGFICSIYGRKNLSRSLVKPKLQINE